jgi:hypothetical protein
MGNEKCFFQLFPAILTFLFAGGKKKRNESKEKNYTFQRVNKVNQEIACLLISTALQAGCCRLMHTTRLLAVDASLEKNGNK